MLATFEHECPVAQQLLVSRRHRHVLRVEHDPAGPSRLQELEAERSAPLRQARELARGLLPLLLETADLGQLRLRLFGFRLLVAETLDEPFEPFDVLADTLRRLGGGHRSGRALAPPGMPWPGEEERAAAVELEHGGRHRLEEPAVVRDDHDGGVERGELVLQPLERVDVEVVRRLVEQEQIGVARKRASQRCPR